VAWFNNRVMAKALATQASMSDAAVTASTGKDWAGWFALLSDTYGVPACSSETRDKYFRGGQELLDPGAP
jgi:hypothetical protein